MREEREWQTIETAPKDGSWVMLAGGDVYGMWDGDEPPCVVGQHVNDAWHLAWYDGGWLGEYFWPTHWMPLPAPLENSDGRK